MTKELRARVERLRDECQAVAADLDDLSDATRDDIDARMRYAWMADAFRDAYAAARLDLDPGQPTTPASDATCASAD